MRAPQPLFFAFYVSTLCIPAMGQPVSAPEKPVIERLNETPQGSQNTHTDTVTNEGHTESRENTPTATTSPKAVCSVDRAASLLNSPDRVGYGRHTRGGADAESITWVTNLNDSGEGSLRAALSQPPPKWIAFDDSLKDGTIYVSSQLPTSGDLTIDGRGSDGPLNITIAATDSITHLLVFWAGNVIIHGVTIDGQNTSATGLMARTGSNFWIDHVTAQNWIADDAVSIGRVGSDQTADNITISNYHARNTSKAILFYGEETNPPRGNLTVFKSILAATERNPKISYQKHAHVFNNYIHSYLYTGIQAHRGSNIFVENNFVSATNSGKKWRAIAGVDWEADTNGIAYSVGNIIENGEEYNVVKERYEIEYDYDILPTDAVVDYVEKNAGAINANLTIELCQ